MTCILGIAFGFAVFRKSDFLAVFITFFLFGESMVVFAFFISTFFNKAQSGVYVGIFVFIIGLMFESFVFSSGYIGYLWWKPSAPLILTYLLSLLPFFNFGKLFLDISTLTTGQLDLITNSYIPGNGLPWANMTLPIPKILMPTYPDSTQPISPTPIQSVYWLLFDIFLYAILTWYFDSVIPNDHGARKSPLFFADPAYWGYEPVHTSADDSEWLLENKEYPPPEPFEIDGDVKTERELALSDGRY
jgi:ABC-2 family transporter protein